MNLNQWAIKHNISPEAVEDLQRQFGLVNTDPNPHGGESEAAIQTRIRIEASKIGARLWRNNVGATATIEGGFIRYGLANDSKQMNNETKSSDLIGLRPVVIQHYHVGQIIGQFVAREVKHGSWKYSGDEKEIAQLNFLQLVASMGGDAAFANSEGTL